MLIAHEIEGKPAVAARMKLAILPGFNVLVPQGKLVGGTFKSTPLCSRPGETGCVIAWISFREKNVPPPGAMFGYCRPARNDRRLRQPGAARLDATGCRSTAIGTRRSSSAGPRRTDRLVDRRAAADPLSAHRRPGLGASASTTARAAICRSAPTPTPRTSAPTASAARSALLGMFLPGWGMHLADMPRMPQGDLDSRAGRRRHQRVAQDDCWRRLSTHPIAAASSATSTISR